MEYSTFVRLKGNADPAKSPKVVIVDGAQGSQSADKIATATMRSFLDHH